MSRLTVFAVPRPDEIFLGNQKFPGPTCPVPAHFSQRSAAITALVKILDAVANNLDHPATLKETVLNSLGFMATASVEVQEAARRLTFKFPVSVPDELIEPRKIPKAANVIFACRKIQRVWRQTLDYRDRRSFDRLLSAEAIPEPRNFQAVGFACVRIQRAYRKFSNLRDARNFERLLSLT